MPLVSICIPTYDYGEFVAVAIESALNQTHDEVEVVVLDDASTDHTPEVLEHFAGHPRFRSERHERNLGLFGSFNRCLEVGRGEYVKVLCADDWLHPRAVEDSLEALARDPAAGMATSPAWHADASGRVIGMVRAPFGRAARTVPGAEALRAHADWGNMAGMPSQVLLRREVVREVGGFEPEFAPASDVHLWLKVLARHDLAWVPEPRCTLRLHDQHDHGYAYEADESTFRLWEDIARREPAAVDRSMLAHAVRREARHHLLYVAHRLLRGDTAAARRLLASLRRHLSVRAALPGFLARLPRLTWDQAQRLFAQRTGRLLVYDPSPRPGPRREADG